MTEHARTAPLDRRYWLHITLQRQGERVTRGDQITLDGAPYTIEDLNLYHRWVALRPHGCERRVYKSWWYVESYATKIPENTQ